MPCLFPRRKEVDQTYLHAHWLELHHMTLSQLLARVMGSPYLACLKQNWPLGWGWGQPSPTYKATWRKCRGVDKIKGSRKEWMDIREAINILAKAQFGFLIIKQASVLPHGICVRQWCESVL